MSKHALFKHGLYVLTVFLIVSMWNGLGGAKTLSLGSGAGNYDDIVSLPVTLDDPSGVSGFSFTLSYDPKMLTFVGIEQGGVPASNGTEFKVESGEVIDEHTYLNPYRSQAPYADVAYDKTSSSTFFHTVNHDEKNGQIMIAGVAEVQPSGTSLFKTRFKVNPSSGLEGNSTVRINPTIIENQGAGYNGTTFLPLLSGMPAADPDNDGNYPTPVYDATLASGTITVTATRDFLHSISGVARYGSDQGVGAGGSTVELLRQGAGGGYILENSELLGSDGAFMFSDIKNGLYALRARSGNPLYYDSPATSVGVNGTDVSGLSLVLGQPFRFSGKVLVGSGASGKSVQGIRIVVRDADGVIKGVYQVSNTGTFSCGPLPMDDYTVEAVYGGQSLVLTEGDNFWALTLRSIQGVVSGVKNNENVMISADSDDSGLQKSILTNVGESGNATYVLEDLLPAADAIVSGTTNAMPTLYYQNATDITAATEVDITAGNATNIDLDFSPFSVDTYGLSGTITNAELPASGENVYAYNVNTRAMTGTISDVNGTFQFAVVPGTYEISVIKENGHTFYYAGNATVRDQKKAHQVILGVSAETGVDLDVFECALALEGRVTFQGDPLGRALLVAQGSDGVRLAAATDSQGTYTLTGLCEGSAYTVRMVPSDSAMPVSTKTLTAHTGATLDFALEPENTVLGTVRESMTSQPIAGATAYLVDKQTGMLVGERMVRSDAGGRFTLSGIVNGLYSLVVSHPEHRSLTMDLTVQGDVQPEVNLVKGAHIKGKVTSGTSVPDVTVMVTGGPTPYYDRTDADGEFEIYGLDNGHAYTVTAVKTGYIRSVQKNVSASLSGTEVSFILSRPLETYTLSGEIRTGCNNATLDGAQIILSSTTNNFVVSGKTDDQGLYQFDNVPKGTDYSLIVDPSGALQQYTEKDLVLTSDLLTHDIVLPCGTESEIKGTITWTGGSTGYVFVYRDGLILVDYQALGTSGSSDYVFTGLRSDWNYHVLAVAAGNVPEWFNGKESGDTADTVQADTAGVNIDLKSQ
jgi:hypothetical protein